MTQSSRAPGPAGRITAAVRRLGWRGLFREGARRVAGTLYERRRLLLFRAPVRDVRRLEPRLEPDRKFETRVVTRAEGLDLARKDDEVFNVIRDLLAHPAKNESLLVALVDGELAGWCLVASNTNQQWPLTETRTYLALEPTDAVFTAGFVVPRFRGRGFFQALYGAAADLAGASGATRLWSWCEHWNHASRGAMLAVGFLPAGTHQRARILGVHTRPRCDTPESPNIE